MNGYSDFNWTNSGGSVSHYAYGYDAAGNRLYKEDKVNTGLSELYGYDNLYQLTSFTRGTLNSTKDAITGTPDYTQSWNHDALGNWDDVTTNGVTEDRAANAQNEYTNVGGNTPTYDSNGNMTTDQTGRHFVWDAWNRLVEVQDASSVTLKTYTYDALNRRMTDSDGTTTKNLYYSTSWQVVLESEGEPTGTTTGMTRYVWSPVYVDAMILRDRDADNDGDLEERLWAVQDANFNMVALVDNSGNVVERYKYTPFGVATVMDASGTVISGSAYGWVHLHQGLRFEEASGLYDNRFRWYSAVLGQFVSNDPIGFDAGDVNVRRYVGNNGANRVDPSGLTDLIVGDYHFYWRGYSNPLALETLHEPTKKDGARTGEKDKLRTDLGTGKAKLTCPEIALLIEQFSQSALHRATNQRLGGNFADDIHNKEILVELDIVSKLRKLYGEQQCGEDKKDDSGDKKQSPRKFDKELIRRLKAREDDASIDKLLDSTTGLAGANSWRMPHVSPLAVDPFPCLRCHPWDGRYSSPIPPQFTPEQTKNLIVGGAVVIAIPLVVAVGAEAAAAYGITEGVIWIGGRQVLIGCDRHRSQSVYRL